LLRCNDRKDWWKPRFWLQSTQKYKGILLWQRWISFFFMRNILWYMSCTDGRRLLLHNMRFFSNCNSWHLWFSLLNRLYDYGVHWWNDKPNGKLSGRRHLGHWVPWSCNGRRHSVYRRHKLDRGLSNWSNNHSTIRILRLETTSIKQSSPQL